MPLTKEEFDEACLALCPLCREKRTLKYREATKEFIHDWGSGHGICWANGLRKSRFSEFGESNG